MLPARKRGASLKLGYGKGFPLRDHSKEKGSSTFLTLLLDNLT